MHGGKESGRPRPARSLRAAVGGMMDWRIFLALFLAGLGVRLLLLGLPGTKDTKDFERWGALAVERGITRVYVLDDSYWVTKALSHWRHLPAPAAVLPATGLGPLDYFPDYPPFSLFLLALSTGMCKVLQGGTLHNGAVLNACTNFLPVLATFATLLTLVVFMRREGLGSGFSPSMLFWLNPALILLSPVLGYADPIFAFFGLLSLISLYRKKYTTCVLFLALSCVTKSLGVLLLPVVAVTILVETERRMARRLLLLFVFFAMLPYVPFAATGNALGVLGASYNQAQLYLLSSQQLNVWWLVGWLLPALAQKNLAPLRDKVGMHPIAEFTAATGANPRWIALALLAAATAFSIFYLAAELRKGNRLAIFWAAAFQVYAFSMLSLYPHENHMYAFFVYSLPLLAFRQRIFSRLFIFLSIIFGLNLFLFYGFGQSMPGYRYIEAWRNFPGIDLTVAISLINMAVFFWIVRAPRWCFGYVAETAEPLSVAQGRFGDNVEQ